MNNFASAGLKIDRHHKDPQDVLVNHRYLRLLLDTAGGPEVVITRQRSDPAHACQGCRTLSAEGQMHLCVQSNPLDGVEAHQASDAAWRRNYPPVADLSD